jgi:hypothetical protein
MNETMKLLLILAGCTAGGIYVMAMVLTLLPRLGGAGRAISGAFARAPLLDLIVAMLTWMPWIAGGVIAGWLGLPAVIIGQYVGMQAWVFTHEAMNRQASRGPRIVKFLNMRFGRVRNHLALWVTLIALPAFWSVRLAEIFCYPLFVWLLRFPRYKQGEWVNVSRHKFEGLVGHDLIWCLYCDWMTGLYSLGAEMLRNVESFWCPIRFYDGKKCENCKLDFPDVVNAWVPADGNMADVETLMQEKYAPGQESSWFGHPARLTVKGEPRKE